MDERKPEEAGSLLLPPEAREPEVIDGAPPSPLAEAEWLAALHIIKHATVGIAETDLAGRFLMANQRYCEIVGRTTEELRRLRMQDITDPNDLPRNLVLFERLASTGQPFTIEKRYVRPDGSQVWVSNTVYRLPRRDGRPQSIVTVTVDIDERKQAEEALREETRTLEVLNRTGAALASELDLNRLVQRVTDAGTELSGAEFGAFFYNVLDAEGEAYMLYTLSGAPREAFSKFPNPRNTAVFGPTFRGEGVVRVDDITKDPRYGRNPPYNGMPKGHLPVRSYLAVPVVSRSGEVLGGLFFGHSTPGVFSERVEQVITGIATQAAVAIDNARLYEAAQRELAERKRTEGRLKTITDNATLALFIMDERQHCVFMNPAAEELTGYTLAEVQGRPLHDVIHHTRPDGRPYPLEESPIDRVFPTNRQEQGEEVFVHRDGSFYPVSFTASPIRHGGTAIGTIVEVQDITERKRAEERQRALIGELRHRVKNILATVQSMAHLTLRDGVSIEDARASFDARIAALAGAQDLLTEANWQSASLRDVVQRALAPYRDEARRRLAIEDGVDVRVGSTEAVALAMGLNELATNATKYGALSVPTGRVVVAWTVDDASETPLVRLTWVESGGPKVAVAARQGFGSTLLKHVLPQELGRDVELAFEPDGVRFAAEIPLAGSIGPDG